jgi:L-alanine-DL-glutamate epimerase-like enolase superfamily enzyme
MRFDIPLAGALHIATMSMERAENLLVKIESSDGVCGWGEASPFRSITGETQAIDLAAASELKSLLVGKNPLAIGPLTTLMSRFLPHNATIRSAFDMALYDVASRYARMPLYRFLGGENRALETDITIYIGDPKEAGAQAEKIVRAGFRVIKVKLGSDRAGDIERVQAIRHAIGDTPRLRIDANQAWDRITALRMLGALEKHSIEFCEQPCPAADHRTLRFLSEHASIPIMADESLFSPEDALALDREDAVAYFNIKLSKSGGIRQAQRIASIAEAGGRRCMMGCMSESRLGITAAAHFALANPAIEFCDLDSFYEHREDPIQGGVVVQDGNLIVPEEPGIGAVPDESLLEKARALA